MCETCGTPVPSARPWSWWSLPLTLLQLTAAAAVVLLSIGLWLLRRSPRVTLIGVTGAGAAYALKATRYYPFWTALTGYEIAGWAILAALTALIALLAEACYRKPSIAAQIASEAVEVIDPQERAEALSVARLRARLQRQIDALGIGATVGAVVTVHALFNGLIGRKACRTPGESVIIKR